MARKKHHKSDTTVVHAAGAVLTRGEGPELTCAVVHRPRYDDWSLPKGKIDAGESLPVTAVRELAEETGFRARLRRRLGVTTYPLKPGTRKQVTYWAATAHEGEFVPGEEVDELRWLPVAEARELVSYALDRKILKRFGNGIRTTTVLLLVRHAKAGSRSEWSGDDDLRPLDKNGRVQAEMLAPLVRAFGGEQLFAAPRVRCEQTLAPLADELDVPVRIEDALSDEAYMDDPGSAVRRLLEIAADNPGPVVCSQGTAIPGIVGDLAARSGLEIADTATKKGGLWALGLDGDRLVFADYYPSPLPVR